MSRSVVTLDRASDGAGGREGVKVESLADVLGGARGARSARDSSPGRRGSSIISSSRSGGGGGSERGARGPSSLGRAGSDVDKVCKVEGLGGRGRGEQLVGSGVLGWRCRGEEVVAASSTSSSSCRCRCCCSGRLAVDGCWRGRVGEVEEQVCAGA